jgi:prepilin peptidase CpaA
MTDIFVSSVLVFTSAWVILTDLFYRRIHNVLIVGLLFGWCGIAISSFWSVGPYSNVPSEDLLSYLGYSIAGAVGVLVVGFGLFLIGQMGAGDVKLMSVLCLWVGYDNQLVFLVVTALVGGMLALLMPVLSLLEIAGAKVIVQISSRFPRLKIPAPLVFSREGVKGLPYGLAISGGAFYLLISPFSH